jgi:hypothetical protein
MSPGVPYPEAMALALGILLLAAVTLLAAGAVTGRVRVRSCCGIADPRRDLRMRSAFTDEPDAQPEQ